MTDQFVYVSVLFSIVIALALTQLLAGIAALLRSARYALLLRYIAWVGVLLFACVDLWFSLWGLRESEEWSLIYVLYLLVLATVLYVACQLIVPDLRDGDSIDLVAFNESRRRKYLAALGLDVALATVQNLTTPGLATANVFNVALVALIGIAWLWRDTRVQMAVVAVFIGLYTYYAATYIPQL